MGQIDRLIITMCSIALLATQIVTPVSAATFDGEWRVQVNATSATCGDGTTVAIDINNGQVASSDAVVAASGHVGDAGNISVTLASGIQRAVGSGRLAGTSGFGTWRGMMCSGTWTAQRN